MNTEKTIKDMKKFAKKLCKSKKKALKFLVNCGICDKTGN